MKGPIVGEQANRLRDDMKPGCLNEEGQPRCIGDR